ncbi:MAG: hypothetical protein ABIV51_13450 [Saprospiraceae bacterium]
MTVAELIEKLNAFPPDSMVVTEGYEEGFDSIKSVSEISLVEAERKEWYLGKYDRQFPDTSLGIKAVFLNAETKSEDK